LPDFTHLQSNVFTHLPPNRSPIEVKGYSSNSMSSTGRRCPLLGS